MILLCYALLAGHTHVDFVYACMVFLELATEWFLAGKLIPENDK